MAVAAATVVSAAAGSATASAGGCRRRLLPWPSGSLVPAGAAVAGPLARLHCGCAPWGVLLSFRAAVAHQTVVGKQRERRRGKGPAMESLALSGGGRPRGFAPGDDQLLTKCWRRLQTTPLVWQRHRFHWVLGLIRVDLTSARARSARRARAGRAAARQRATPADARRHRRWRRCTPPSPGRVSAPAP